MPSKTSLTKALLAKAESHGGIRAGIVRLQAVLKSPSYETAAAEPGGPDGSDSGRIVDWPAEAQTVLTLGLHHPESDPQLDWWDGGDTLGNRRLRAISDSLTKWLRENCGVKAYPLPYDVEKEGLFLKDAAVLCGIGIIGRNNLLLHSQWGPRIRLRSILLEGEFQDSAPLEGFSPCETCGGFCQKTCPVNAFPRETYRRAICAQQMAADFENSAADGEYAADGQRHSAIKYCRACELSCPVGAP